MRFLLRLGFWLGVILVLLPSGGAQPTQKVQVGATEAMTAARATVSDMRQFCERQPETCTVGSQAAVVIGHRAQAGAKMLYEFLNEHLGPNETGAVTTGSPAEATTAIPLPAPRPSLHTLSPGDLAPNWRGPQPRQDTRNEAPAP
jgi:hypothetical protein